MNRISVFERVAKQLNGDALLYSVVHGIDEYPRSVGRDLDLLMLPEQIGPAIEAVRGVLEEMGLSVVEPPPLWGRRLVAADASGRGGMVEVHIQADLHWRNVRVAQRPRPSHHQGPFPIDPWNAWSKRVLLTILSADSRRIRERGPRLKFGQFERDAARARLPGQLGRTLANRLITSLDDEDLESVITMAPKCRRAAMMRSLAIRPFASLAWPIRALKRRLSLPFSVCAPVIALVGPDGVGKSTILERLAATEDWVFLDVVCRHWRPSLLPQLGSFVGRRGPAPGEARPPRRTAGRFPRLRLGYYATDVLVGSLLSDRPAASRQKLVVYDRCFLDMAVDPLRYGLPNGKGVRQLWRLLPKPHRIIALHGIPSAIHERKPELPVDAIQQQLMSWKTLQEEGEITECLDVDRPIEDVVDSVRSLAVQAFLDINRDSPVRIEKT